MTRKEGNLSTTLGLTFDIDCEGSPRSLKVVWDRGVNVVAVDERDNTMWVVGVVPNGLEKTAIRYIDAEYDFDPEDGADDSCDAGEESRSEKTAARAI
jgi:hypothetical protein